MHRSGPLALGLAVCGLYAVAAGADAIDDGTPAAATAWVGKWRLDRDRSDPDESLLIALDVSWMVRKIAAAFTPTFAVTASDGGVGFATKTPLGSRVDRFHGDGVERDGEDLLGRSYRESSRWTPEGHLVVNRALKLDDRTTDIEIVWSVNGATLVSITTVEVEADSRLRVRRVFDRVTGDDS